MSNAIPDDTTALLQKANAVMQSRILELEAENARLLKENAELCRVAFKLDDDRNYLTKRVLDLEAENARLLKENAALALALHREGEALAECMEKKKKIGRSERSS